MVTKINLLSPITPPSLNYEDPAALWQATKPSAAPMASAPAVKSPQVQQTPAIDSSQYLAGLFNQKAPAPAYDQAGEESLRNMARNQKIGDFLTLVGDLYGAIKGAPVQARQFQSSAPYLNRIMEKREQYRKDMQDYQNKEYARKIQAATLAARDAQAKAALAQRQAQFDATQGLKERQFSADQLYKQYLIDNGLEDNKLARDKFDEDMRQFGITSDLAKKRFGLEAQRVAQGEEKLELEKEKGATTKTGKPFTKANWRGTEIPIYEGEYRNLLEAGLRRSGKGDVEIKTLLARYQHQPTEEYKQIAAQEKIKQLEEQENAAVMPTLNTSFIPSQTKKTPSLFGGGANSKPSLFQ